MATVYRYSIRQHHDQHAAYGDPNTGTPLSVHVTGAEACNALLRLADEWESKGGTVSGGGFVFYVTTPAGDQVTYRTWQV